MKQQNKTEKVSESFETIKTHINDILKNINFDIFNKHKSIIITGIVVLGIAVFTPSIISYTTNNLTYGQIPKLYKESMMYKGEAPFVLYVDNTELKLDLIKGFYNEKDNAGKFIFHKGLMIHTPIYEGEKSLGGYSLIESEKSDFEIDALDLQEKSDRFLDNGIEMKYKQEGKSNIFNGGMVKGDRNAYDTKLFKLVDNNVSDSTFFAAGFDRSVIDSLESKYSEDFFEGISQTISVMDMYLFNFNPMLKKLSIYDEFYVLSVLVPQKIANYENVVFTATQEGKKLVLRYDVIGDEIIVDDIIAKSMCSKAKTVHLSNKEENDLYKLKGMECDYEILKKKVSVVMTYNDFEAHLKAVQ